MKNTFPVKILTAAITTIMLITPVFADKMDDDIAASANKSYVFSHYLKDDAIKVKVDDGVVTLTGTVADEAHKTLAQDTVSNLPGVKNVENDISIAKESPSKNSDGWLVTKVKTTLLFHKNVSAMTEVDAKDGVITLSGKTDSQAEKELTTEYAQDIVGVKSVKNDMTVGSMPKQTTSLGEKIDDASTTASVKIVLLSHRSTSAMNTGVSTKDGIVTLTGEAENDAEISLATKLSSDVKGVDKVINQMIVTKATKSN